MMEINKLIKFVAHSETNCFVVDLWKLNVWREYINWVVVMASWVLKNETVIMSLDKAVLLEIVEVTHTKERHTKVNLTPL